MTAPSLWAHLAPPHLGTAPLHSEAPSELQAGASALTITAGVTVVCRQGGEGEGHHVALESEISGSESRVSHLGAVGP